MSVNNHAHKKFKDIKYMKLTVKLHCNNNVDVSYYMTRMCGGRLGTLKGKYIFHIVLAAVRRWAFSVIHRC